VWIIEYLNQNGIEIALHAGDMINPGILYRFRDHYKGHLHFVFGNNDGEQALAERRANLADNLTCHLLEVRLEIEGKQIFMNHYSSISESVAKSGEFDLCVGGHDHLYRTINHGSSLFINPGNTVTKDKWLPQKPDEESSFAIIDFATMEAKRVMLPKEFQL
jgi:putative phosphoesterase